ncbi:MAG: hypothetical protein MRZ79_15230 [Bacteroidia bacterium]|nr:hypothetical protein [Bacteroidia bacterium]
MPIAQQVAEVYSQAVTKTLTEVVQNIYQRVEVQEGWIMLVIDLQVGERVKLITETASKVYEVSAVEKDHFQVMGLNTNSANVFVYGREVDDFHTVDYEAISMLNVSATQEQQHRIEALEAENNLLKTKNAAFEARLQALESFLIKP